MKKLLLVIGMCVVSTLLMGPPLHAATGERIRDFDSQVLITQTNVAVITETIVYDFGTNSRHGIYRDVPIDYKDGSDSYYLNFQLKGVYDESGFSVQTEQSKENGNMRIRIGDPDRTITGVHTYKIVYALFPIVTKLNDKPFLNLDVVGEGWEVPIDNISAKVILEDSARLQTSTWYGYGEQTTDSAEYTATGHAAYQGVTINAVLPDGYVDTYLEPNKRRASDIAEQVIGTVIGFAVALPFMGGIGIVIARAVRSHRRRKEQTVIPEYEPPDGMLPGHIGLLQDDVAAGREVTATVIDWAVRGFIKIEYIPKKGLFGSKDYRLVPLKDISGLSPIEQTLYSAFFPDNIAIQLTELNKVTMSQQVTAFQASLKTELTNKGYYDKDGNLFMRGTITDAGAKEWAKVDGFRLYLNTVEKDRLKFSDAPDKTPERFSAMLPYAIALGVEKQWAKQFEGIDLTQSTTWYTGNLAAFSAVSLASDLGSSFANTVSSNSSVSSSGGSSGGGFGGGGGGSW